jgi:hypothetical protein
MTKNLLMIITTLGLANIAGAADLVHQSSFKEEDVSERVQEAEATKEELIHHLVCSNIKRAFAGFYAEQAALILPNQTSEQWAANFVDSFIERPSAYFSLPLGRVGTKTRTNFISVVDLFRTIAAIKDRSLLISNPDELRYLPNSLEGVHIFMVASELAPLTPEKVSKVIKFAKFHRVHISVVTVNPALSSTDRTILNSLATETDGYPIDMVRIKDGCFPPART